MLSCHSYGMMAYPGATFLELYDAVVILLEYNLYTSVVACQACPPSGRRVWARECWSNGVMSSKKFLFL